MRFIIIVFLLFMSCQTKCQTNDKTFEINKNMIASFNAEKFEIQLELKDIDYSKYSYIRIEGYSEKILIIDDTMSFRPSDIFVYRNKKQPSSSTGLIKLQVKHLDAEDERIKKLKEIFE